MRRGWRGVKVSGSCHPHARSFGCRDCSFAPMARNRGTTLYCEKLIRRRVLRLKPALNVIKARLHTVMNQG